MNARVSPPSVTATPPAPFPRKMDRETTMLRIAREMAMGLLDLSAILKNNNVSSLEWNEIRVNPHFSSLLESETAAWHAASNTHERTKLKAAAVIEEWLLEANGRLHDASEHLNHKVELGKLIAKIAGMGETQAAAGSGGGERFSLTINIGDDREHRVSVERVTPNNLFEINRDLDYEDGS